MMNRYRKGQMHPTIDVIEDHVSKCPTVQDLLWYVAKLTKQKQKANLNDVFLNTIIFLGYNWPRVGERGLSLEQASQH